MHISASIFSNKSKSIKTLIKDLEDFEIDALHIDCNDDLQIFEQLQEIRAITHLPFDMHVISDTPSKFYDKINEFNIEQSCFQIESLKEPVDFSKIHSKYKGMAICTDTDINLLTPYQEEIQYVLVMTTVPGQSGGVFQRNNFNYIRAIQQKFPQLKIQVDGGVNHEVSFILRVLGVDGIVSGSYLVNHDNIGVAYIQLTSKNTPSHFLVEDFMIPIGELPIIQEDNSSLEQLLRINEDFKMGCTLVVNQNKHLVGLSTNADIRRGLLKNKLTIHDSPIADFVNKNPLVVNAKNTIKEMLEIIKAVPFPVLLLPVIEKDRTLKGIVMFNNLIKGE